VPRSPGACWRKGAAKTEGGFNLKVGDPHIALSSREEYKLSKGKGAQTFAPLALR
jgi:hypothetical protein